MANDKLINHTQGETIITKLTSIADALDDLSAISPAKFGMGLAVTNTPASTAAKTANIANFILTEGGEVNITFTYANTASNATLNINNTGAKPILYKGSPITADIISAGDTCTFIYSSANGGSYNIINIDALSGAGAGTVKSVGASTGLKTDQTSGAAINITGTVKLDLTSETPFEGTAPAPVEIEDKIYPVALDAAGHPAVSVPGTEYTQGAGINISENNVITNTGVFDVTTPTSSDTTATNGDIKVIKKVVNNGVTTESATFVKPKGINDPAFKSLDSSTSGLTSDDNHVPTSKTVQDAIDTALASASIYKGTISAFNDLPTSTPTDTVRKGWYYRVSTAWSAATGTPATHVGDIIIAEKDSPSKAIDSANWSLLHNEANTDANVTQSPVSTNANYEVLFSGSADNTSHTEGTGKDSGLTYNPSTNKLTVSGEVSASSYSGLPDGNTTTKGIVQLGTDADKAASGSHGHGNITNGGALQTTDVAIASGDKLVITDASDSNKVARASVSFDGSTATQALTKKGTFENFQAPISASNKLSSDLVDDTNKTHKFATADQLTQIATNKTNILCALNKTGTNWLYDYEHGMENPTTLSGVTFTWLKNGKLSIKSTGINTSNVWYDLEANIRSKYIGKILSFVGGVDNKCVLNVTTTGGTSVAVSSGDDVTIPSTGTNKVYILVLANAGEFDIVVEPMIRDATITSNTYSTPSLPNSDLTQGLAELNAHPFLTVPINHNMVYRGQNLGTALTDAQHTALSSGNFTDLYLGDYWTKSVTIPAFYEVTTAEPANWSTNYTSYYTKSGNTYTAVSGSSAPTWAANTYYERQVPEQTVTLKAVIADFDTFYAGYASGYAGINTHHAAVIVTGFSNVVWNGTNSTAGGYVNSLIHKWLVGSVLPQIETWFGSAKVLSHQKLLTNAITGDAASGWAWSSQKISLLSENQIYGSKIWGNSKATNGGYEPGEAFKHLNVFNHIDANLLFGNKNIWLRDIASAGRVAFLNNYGFADRNDASHAWIAPAALILLS